MTPLIAAVLSGSAAFALGRSTSSAMQNLSPSKILTFHVTAKDKTKYITRQITADTVVLILVYKDLGSPSGLPSTHDLLVFFQTGTGQNASSRVLLGVGPWSSKADIQKALKNFGLQSIP